MCLLRVVGPFATDMDIAALLSIPSLIGALMGNFPLVSPIVEPHDDPGGFGGSSVLCLCGREGDGLLELALPV